MNPTLARIYGQSRMSKTASDEANVAATPTEPAETEIDLTQISAAEYLQAMEEIAAEEAAAVPGGPATDEAISKIASSGQLAHWDAVGRIMAHSMMDEMSKIASGSDDALIPIESLNAAQLVELIESGEYELVETPEAGEKVAGRVKDAVGNWMQAGKHVAGKAGEAIKNNPKKSAVGAAVGTAAAAGGAFGAHKFLKKKDKK